MIDTPRGKYLGERLGDRPASEAEHFIRFPAAMAGSIAAISAKSSSTMDRYHTRRRINRNEERPALCSPSRGNARPTFEWQMTITHPNPIDAHVGSRMRMRRMMLGMSQEKLGEKGMKRMGSSRLQHAA